MQPIFNPLDAMLQGQQLWRNAQEAGEYGQTHADEQAAREAAALMGQGQNLTGYEDMPGATRPNWLRELFLRGNPDTALKFEERVSAPYANQRQIATAGKIEQAKKEADQQVWNTLLQKYFPASMEGTPGPAMGASPVSAPVAEGAPAGSNAMNTALMPQPNLAGLSDQERSFELGPQGPKLAFKQSSPFDRGVKMDEQALKREDLTFRKQVQADELPLKQEDVAIKGALARKDLSKDKRDAIQEAHVNVLKIGDQIRETQKAMQSREIPWEEGQATIAALKGEFQQAKAQRDALLTGKPLAPQAAAIPAAMESAAPTVMPTAKAAASVTPPEMTEKEQAQLHMREQDPAVKLEAKRQVDDKIKQINDQILTVQTAMEERRLPQAKGQKQVQALQAELNGYLAQRDGLAGGKPAESAPAAPAAPPSLMPSPRSMKPAAASPGPAPQTSRAPQFTERESAALATKDREEKIAAANKEIANAREHATKLAQYRNQVKEIYDLVAKQDMGHPFLGALPGGMGTYPLMLDKDNAKLKNLNDALTNMFSQPGQSQLMNTIIERQMQSATIPGIAVDPQQNKINAATVRSNVEHLMQLPTFLEKWQKAHGGTLDGATEAWLDYTQHNPGYTYTQDKRGRVKVQENPNVVPVTRWMQLRQAGRVREIKGKTFLQEDDGSWREQ